MPEQHPVERTPFPAEAERQRSNRPVAERPEFEGRQHVDPFDPDASRERPAGVDSGSARNYDAAGQPAARESLPSRSSAVIGDETPSSGTAAIANEGTRGATRDGMDAPLLPESEAARLRKQWTEYQANFVDAPKDAVKSADELVAEVMQRVAKEFADRRSSLESKWSRGEDVSTEDLRVALQSYREFFNRLLAA